MELIDKIKKELKSQRFFKDSWLLGLFFIAVILNVFVIFWSLTHIHATSVDLPVRFTSLSNFDELGSWFKLFDIAAISLIVGFINLFLAVILHAKNRILSIFLMITSIMVAILAIAILLGFTVIKYGTN